ncbi:MULTISPECIES: DUF1697 domain-containing protein [Mycolicibacterium]|uniref:Pyridoxamine 5'-phosphate oxidase family protein n=1 Tax=Mycolicibacterium gilvum TaxID=1804 RepID=A0A378SV71_9MYCO|nr:MULTISPECIES: DUF1697 domain-containing protein [Mycolicibacterium]MBV5242210.1 DUF1697 domain-containing protein [Mycolicibacterium sp. PAM1]MCV7053982.1 DUF1697 domain-containing protein [Mycolicibacterium gilvum]STZ46245.1 pyridoxamine 5'-phosphate oxidase family protein [Mycolicibacterium gilvum]
MGSTRYAALLRGINVGGRNKITMADLRAAFSEAGFGGVSTYIQSGNVAFESGRRRASLESDIETLLADRLQSPPVVVVRSHAEMRAIVEEAPADFVARTVDHHRDVVFLKEPLTADRALEVIQVRDGVDEVWPGPGVVYFTRVSAERTRSMMNRIVGKPEYRLMTIRNWATTSQMLSILDGMG